MTFEELFLKGGPVVWVLVGYSVLGLAIVTERCLHFLRMGRISHDLEPLLLSTANPDDGLRGPEASFVLLESGRIEKLSLSGGHKLLRRAARKAVEAALPLPSPPAELKAPFKVAFAMEFELR